MEYAINLLMEYAINVLMEYGTKAFDNPNPTHGSGWSLQILSTRPSPNLNLIPPTAVGGYFRSSLEENLNNPPTTVGGIESP